MRSPDVIETERVDVLKSINESRDLINTVSERIHTLEVELLELKEARRKARFTMSARVTQEKILASEYWQSRNGGTI